MEIVPKTIDYYYTQDAKCSYKEWFSSLKDEKIQQAIDARLTRVRRGLLGDYNWVGQGVWELRFDIGPGYRIYFGQLGNTIILLLCGGHKKTQNQDIQKAQTYWSNYRREHL